MPNIFVEIGEGVEVGAKDFVDFLDKVKATGEQAVTPRALIALAVLGGNVGKAVVSSLGAAAVDGMNIPLDMESAQLIVQCWPSLLAYLQTLAIQPAKGKSS